MPNPNLLPLGLSNLGHSTTAWVATGGTLSTPQTIGYPDYDNSGGSAVPKGTTRFTGFGTNSLRLTKTGSAGVGSMFTDNQKVPISAGVTYTYRTVFMTNMATTGTVADASKIRAYINWYAADGTTFISSSSAQLSVDGYGDAYALGYATSYPVYIYVTGTAPTGAATASMGVYAGNLNVGEFITIDDSSLSQGTVGQYGSVIKIESLRERYDSPVRFNPGTGPDTLWFPFGDADTSEVSATGLKRVTLPFSTNPSGFNTGTTKYDLQGSSIIFNWDLSGIVGNGNAYDTIEFGLYDYHGPWQNFVRFSLDNTSGNLNSSINHSNYDTSGSGSSFSTNVSLNVYKYFRIRESAGTVYTDISVNGFIWIPLGSQTWNSLLNRFQVQFYMNKTTPSARTGATYAY